MRIVTFLNCSKVVLILLISLLNLSSSWNRTMVVGDTDTPKFLLILTMSYSGGIFPRISIARLSMNSSLLTPDPATAEITISVVISLNHRQKLHATSFYYLSTTTTPIKKKDVFGLTDFSQAGCEKVLSKIQWFKNHIGYTSIWESFWYRKKSFLSYHRTKMLWTHQSAVEAE